MRKDTNPHTKKRDCGASLRKERVVVRLALLPQNQLGPQAGRRIDRFVAGLHA